MRRVGWIAMTVLSVGVALYATSLLFLSGIRPPFVQDRLMTMPLVVYAHFVGGALALALGPFQFLASLRARAPEVHRSMGRLYLGGSVIGGLAGLVMALVSEGGIVAHLGFGLLAVVWVVASLAAYRSIRKGDVWNHRRWMTRSFALTFAAVTLRVYLPLGLVAGVPFTVVYPAVAWLAWVPNLALVEWRLTRAGAPRSSVAV